MKTFRLIRSQPASATYNMELDKKILGRYLEDGVPVFRVYGWEKPSFTYGVSGSPEGLLDLERCERDSVDVVKRMTGGGILFHDDEITYSFVCGKGDVGEPSAPLVAYREICAFLIRFYDSLGLKASFAIEDPRFKARCVPHKICSASCEKYDIVINGRKIGGNAQKRSRQAIFQHGSIPRAIAWELMRRYIRSMPEGISSGVTTLSDEIAVIPDRNVLEERLIAAFGGEFTAEPVEESESLYETRVAQ
jgi:lipoate-protein ligase A